MEVGQPEILIREMYGDPDRPIIQQDNNIDADFDGSGTPGIPQDLLAIVLQPPSVDAEPEEIEQVENGVVKVDVEKVTEENAQSRFRVTDTATLKPGTCVLCKSSGGDGRQFVDLGIQVTWVGAIYFCTFCVAEVANILGYERRSVWTLAHENLQEEISQGDDRYVEAKVKLDAALLLLRDCNCGNLGPVVPSGPYILESPSEPDIPEPDADESGDVEGSGDVPEFASYEELAQPQSEPAKPVRRSRKSA